MCLKAGSLRAPHLLPCCAPTRSLLNTVTLVCSLITDAKARHTRANLALVWSVLPTPARMTLSISFDKSAMPLPCAQQTACRQLYDGTSDAADQQRQPPVSIWVFWPSLLACHRVRVCSTPFRQSNVTYHQLVILHGNTDCKAEEEFC